MAAVEDQAEEEDRVSCARGHQGRAQDPRRSSGKGAQAPHPGLRRGMSTRLPGSRYRRVFDRGRSVRGRLLVAWHLETPDADRRAGVVVSKKSFHNAVDRNRAKRQAPYARGVPAAGEGGADPGAYGMGFRGALGARRQEREDMAADDCESDNICTGNCAGCDIDHSAVK